MEQSSQKYILERALRALQAIPRHKGASWLEVTPQPPRPTGKLSGLPVGLPPIEPITARCTLNTWAGSLREPPATITSWALFLEWLKENEVQYVVDPAAFHAAFAVEDKKRGLIVPKKLKDHVLAVVPYIDYRTALWESTIAERAKLRLNMRGTVSGRMSCSVPHGPSTPEVLK